MMRQSPKMYQDPLTTIPLDDDDDDEGAEDQKQKPPATTTAVPAHEDHETEIQPLLTAPSKTTRRRTQPLIQAMPAVPNGSIVRVASLTEDLDQFRAKFTADCSENMKNAYSMFREVYRSPNSGSLSTSIAEDVITLLRIQNDVLTEYLSQQSISKDDCDELVWEVYHCIFDDWQTTHANLLPLFLHSLEDCCAAANDFFRMSNKLEVFCDALVTEFEMPERVRQEGRNVVAKLSQDAVYAAERIQVFFIRQVNQTNIPGNFFSEAWEEDWTHNEVMVELLQQLDLLLLQVETFLENELLFNKVLITSCRALVCFYIRCLVEKADAVCRRKRGNGRLRRRRRSQAFHSPNRALMRMQDDIQLMQQFFAEQCSDDSGNGSQSDNSVTLSRILANELRMLEVIYECLAADDTDSLETMIVVLHKRTGADTLVTRYFVGDLWALVSTERRPQKNEFLQGVIHSVEPDLEMVSKGMKEARLAHGSSPKTDLSFLRIDEMLRSIYEDRIAQGILPLCWACLPKTENSDGSKELVAEKIRKLTRKVIELPHHHQRHANAKQSTLKDAN